MQGRINFSLLKAQRGEIHIKGPGVDDGFLALVMYVLGQYHFGLIPLDDLFDGLSRYQNMSPEERQAIARLRAAVQEDPGGDGEPQR